MNKLKDSKGITLLALTITIIVMMILSGTLIISTNNQIESRRHLSEHNCNIILRNGYDIIDNLKKINRIYELWD